MSQSLAGMVATWLNIGNGHACFNSSSLVQVSFGNIVDVGCCPAYNSKWVRK